MFKKFFDLSQPVYANCPGWPTYEMTDVIYEAIVPNDGYTAEQIRMNVHTGTHLDAPYHFFPEGAKIDEIPLEKFQGKAILIDLRTILKPKEGITVSHLNKYSSLIKPGDIAVFNTGWGKKRALTSEYYHDWPYLTAEGAQWLLSKEVKGVGTDGMSMGGWFEGTGRPCHEILLKVGVWLLEELNIPDELMRHEACYLMAFPLKLRGFSGSPVRAIAAVE
jgi:kynurenine formamidase